MAAPQPQPPEVISRRIELALRMIELGAWVFPLAPNAKEPWVPKKAGGEGFHDAKPDPDLARTFLSNPGQLNYGVVFPEGSDIIVLDIDGGDRSSRPGWVAEWQALYERHGPPGLTYIVRTPSAGRHAYYRWRTDLYGPIPPGDEMLGWTVRKPWKGYVVGPGSVVRGQVYEPVGVDLIVDLAEAWCQAALEEKTRPRSPGVRLTVGGGPAAVEVGHRHAYLRNQARHLVGVGLTGDALFTAVMDLNRQMAEPKTEDEVRRAIGQAEEKFEADKVSAQRNGGLGRNQRKDPEVIEGLTFRSAAEVTAMTPEVIDWAWRDYLAHGTIVELIGPPKAGKTTLVFGLIRSYVAGQPFLDRPTGGGSVVVLSEQGATSLRAVLVRTGLTECPDVHLLLHRETRGHEWADVVESAVARCREVGARLLVVDTLPAFAGLAGDAENNAGDALEAMEPLLHAAADGLAVLVNRHRRKGLSADIADEGRGSGAFSGAVDVILSIRRKDGGSRPTIRVLAAASRFDETPEELYVELEEGGHYVALGNDAAVEAAEARRGVIEALEIRADQTLGELTKSTGKSRTTLQRVIADLERTRDVGRNGGGSRSNPYRFYLVDDDSGFVSAQTPTPYGGEVNGGSGQTTVSSPDCGDYMAHRSDHYQDGNQWRCRRCEEERRR